MFLFVNCGKVSAILLLILSISSAMRLPILPFQVPISESNMEKLQSIDETENAEEYSGQFEGDIILSPEQIGELTLRNGLSDEKYSWPNHTVVYEITDDFEDEQRDFIRKALDDMEAVTCLKFLPRTTEESYIRVTGEDTGCHSQVGFQGEVQDLNLQGHTPGKGCMRKGTIIHEFIHALGFFHQQSAADRDEYVEIVWDNIEVGKRNNFIKHESSTSFGFPYDYHSVMHYSDKAFSSNGQRTIIPKDATVKIGQREQMSETDIQKLNRKYCTQERGTQEHRNAPLYL